MTKRNKKILWISIGLAAAALITVSLVIFYYISVMNKTLNEITTAKPSKTIISVYVLKSDKASQIYETAGYKYGVNIKCPDRTNLTASIKKLETVFKSKPQTLKYQNMFLLADGLKEQQVQAILLNDSYVNIITETPGFEWFGNDIKKIGSFEFENDESTVKAPETMPENFILYISGIDTYGNIGTRSRSDVNILAAVNTSSKQIFMLSTPRDYYIDFSAANGNKDKLTHAGLYGINASIDALEKLYDIDINYYLRINFSGFVDLIDALGGVEVYSEYDFYVENIKHFTKGCNSLNGIEALAFARERHSFSSGDYQRAANQMEVIKAVINKLTSTALLENYQNIMQALAESFETNMPSSHIKSIVSMQLSSKEKWNISSHTTKGTNAYRQTYSMPGRNLFVVLPDEQEISRSKTMLKNALLGKSV